MPSKKQVAVYPDSVKQNELNLTLGSGSYDIPADSFYTISISSATAYYMHVLNVKGETTNIQRPVMRPVSTAYTLREGISNADAGQARYVYWQYYYHTASPELAKAILRKNKIVGFHCGIPEFEAASGWAETKEGILIMTKEIDIPLGVIKRIKAHKDFKDCVHPSGVLRAEGLTQKLSKAEDFIKAEGLWNKSYVAKPLQELIDEGREVID